MEGVSLKPGRPIFASSPSFAACHASTLVELPDGSLLAAWFGGTKEGAPDVAIWLAACRDGAWSTPVRVADQPDVPLWNPVLFLHPSGAVWLFYNVAPTIPAWIGAYIVSHDNGQTWSPPTVLPAGLIGPAKNKPLLLSNGDILCGSSSEAWRAWACWVEISSDQGATWTRHGPIIAPADNDTASQAQTWDGTTHDDVLPQNFRGVIQPTVWEYAPGQLKMLMRSTPAVGFVCSAESMDYGRSWSQPALTDIPHSNTGLDAVRLSDGHIVLICTPAHTGRTPLAVLVSEDNGTTWTERLQIEHEPGEYSYPAVIQAADGRVHVVYTYRRQQIRHAVLELDDLNPQTP